MNNQIRGDGARGLDLPSAAAAFLKRELGSLIDGKVVDREAMVDVFDPASGEVIARVSTASPKTVEAAVQSAHKAFEDGRWRMLRPADRERILLRFADLVEKNGDELAALETLNQGKSVRIARMLDVGATVEFMRYNAGLATKMSGETFDVSIPLPPGAKYTAYTRREPVGVVAGITPWNFPMMIALWKAIPALAAGCSIIVKPSPVTPLTTLRVAELALEAGVPPGVFNVLMGDAEAGSALASHPLVRKVSITGSTRAGKAVAHAAIENLAHFTLELGGKNPAIFLQDADYPSNLHMILMSAFLNQGQVCAAASRFYVHRSIHDGFVDAVTSAIGKMRYGSGFDPEAQMTPLVSSAHRDNVARLVDMARDEGAIVTTGGRVPDGPGYFYPCTVITNANNAMQHVRAEIFGPVLSVIPFDTDDEAISLANESSYGLAASLWTNDLRKAMNLVPRIQAGTVWVNSHNVLDPHMPFGGYKQSGMGREFGARALEAYTDLKSVCIAH